MKVVRKLIFESEEEKEFTINRDYKSNGFINGTFLGIKSSLKSKITEIVNYYMKILLLKNHKLH